MGDRVTVRVPFQLSTHDDRGRPVRRQGVASVQVATRDGSPRIVALVRRVRPGAAALEHRPACPGAKGRRPARSRLPSVHRRAQVRDIRRIIPGSSMVASTTQRAVGFAPVRPASALS